MHNPMSPSGMERGVNDTVYVAVHAAMYDAVGWAVHNVTRDSVNLPVHDVVGWSVFYAAFYDAHKSDHTVIDKFVEETEQNWSAT